MPSASPIIRMMLVMKNETGKSWLIKKAIAIARMIATKARIIGMKAATMGPKTRIRTTKATGMALNSVARSSSAMVSKVVLMLPKPNVRTVKPASPSNSPSVSKSASACSEASSRLPTSFA